MFARTRAPARLNVRMLVIFAVVAIVLVAGAYVGHKVRKRMILRSALEQGTAAYQNEDWETAATMLGRWLSAWPMDVAVLPKFAHAHLSARPLEPGHIGAAIGAYRRMLQSDAADQAVFQKLTQLYEMTGNASELAHVSELWLQSHPLDPTATLALAKADIYRRKADQARAQLEQLVAALDKGPDKPQEFVEACILLASLSPDSATQEQWAATWLDRAVAECADSPLALVHRAALRRGHAEQASREPDQTLLASARTDLERAEQLGGDDPRVWLMLSEEWMEHGETEHARRQLEAAQQIAPEVLREYVVDPSDWTAACFLQAARLSLVSGPPEQGAILAEQALTRLEKRPQRIRVLPMAVELLVAAGRTDAVRALIEELREAAKLRQGETRLDEQIAFLEAIAAGGEDDWYDAIRHLEPIVSRPGSRAVTRRLLAEAYRRTGQLGRMVNLLSEPGAERALNAKTRKTLARSYVARGAWQAALEVLQPLSGSPDDDLESTLTRLAAEIGVASESSAAGPRRELARMQADLRALREARPEQVEVRLLLATVAELTSGPPAAEAELRGAIAECAEPLAALISLARLVGRDRPAEAEDILRTACAEHGQRAASWLALSGHLTALDRVADARAELQRALETIDAESERRDVAVRLAGLEISGGQADAGADRLRGLADADPRDARARTLLLSLPELDATEAARRLAELRSIEGESGVLWRYHQARLWLAEREWHARRDEIKDMLQRCMAADQQWAAPLLLLGQVHERLGEWDAAERVYQASDSTAAMDRLLTLLLRQRRAAEARDLLARLEQRMGREALGPRRMLVAYQDEDYDEALQELNRRIGEEGQDPLALVWRARVKYRQRRDVAGALADLDRALELAPDLATAIAARVGILKGEGRFDEAVAALDAFVAHEKTPEALLQRALYHESVGNRDLAQRDYGELIEVTEDEFGYAALGEFHAQASEFDQAIAAWEEGLARFPEGELLKRGLAKALLTRAGPGDRERAAKYMAELTETAPSDADLIWVRAVERLSAGTPESLAEVRDLLRQAIDAPPARAEVYRGLVGVASQIEEYGLALELVAHGLQMNPGNVDLLLPRARLELTLGKPDAARQSAGRVLDIERDNLEALGLVLEAAAAGRQVTELNRLRKGLEGRLESDPDSTDLQLLLARLLIALDQRDGAQAGLRAFCATEAGAESVAALLLLQDLYRLGGEFETAHATLARAAELAPDDPGVLTGRLLLLAAERRFDDIAALMVDRELTFPATVALLGAEILATSRDHAAAAIAACERTIEATPDFVPARTTLALLLYQGGQVERAADAYRTLLKMRPAHHESLNNLAWILAESSAGDRNMLEEALAGANLAVRLRPNDANYRDTLGNVLLKMGRLDSARDEFRRCVDLAPRGTALREKSLLHLARACQPDQRWEPLRAYTSDLDDLLQRGAAGRSTLSPEELAELGQLRQQV